MLSFFGVAGSTTPIKKEKEKEKKARQMEIHACKVFDNLSQRDNIPNAFLIKLKLAKA